MAQYLGIDLGSSALKCLVVDDEGRTLASSRVVLERSMPQPGYLEQQPADWWRAACKGIPACLEKLADRRIDALSFSGHMSAPVLLDSAGTPLRSAMLIADGRAQRQAEMLEQQFRQEFIDATGNPPLNAFAAARLLWVAQNQPDIYEKTATILFAKDYLRMRICGDIATEPTDAGNSLLYSVETGGWNNALIRKIGLDPAKFAPLRDSTGVCGAVTSACAAETGLAEGTPVVCGAADMACSQAGSGALAGDVTAITCSTSIQVVEAAAETHPAFVGKNTYHSSALPGGRYIMSSIFSGGMSIDWLLRLTHNGAVSEADYAAVKEQTLARYTQNPDPGAVFLPFLAGSGSPWFNGGDAGLFHGLRAHTDATALLLATFEGISFNVLDNVSLLASVWKQPKRIYLGGGGSRFPVWPGLMANVLGRPVHLLRNRDTATIGAAMLACVGVGGKASPAQCFDEMNGVEQTVDPQPGLVKLHEGRYKTYTELLNATRAVSL